MGEKSISMLSKITISIALILAIALVLCIKENNTTTSNVVASNVLDTDSIMDVSIDMSDEDWDDLLENAMKEEYKSATVTINGETFHNVGVRAKGNSSLMQVADDETTDRYSLKIDFDQFVDDQTYHGIETLVLNNGILDKTYMKEYIAYDLFDYLGLATPECQYANIKINNKNWGLYLAVEVIGESVIEKNYGTTEGNLYKPETLGVMGEGNILSKIEEMLNDKENGKDGGQGGKNDNPGEIPGEDVPDMQEPPNNENVTNNTQNESGKGPGNAGGPGKPGGPGDLGGPGGVGRDPQGADFKYIDDNVSSYSVVRDSAVFNTTSDSDFKKVITMLKSLNEGTDIDKYLNVEDVLKYFAVNTFILNFDSYSGGMYHNYYLYENNGYCTIIPWDLNMAFGGFGVQNGSEAINYPIDSPVLGNLEDAPLIGKLLEVDEYKELYHKYLKQIGDEYFNSGRYQTLIQKVDKLIDNYVKTDATAFFTYDEYKASINEMITFGKDRATAVQAQLDGKQPTQEYGNVETSLNIDALGVQAMPDENHEQGNKDNSEFKGNGKTNEESNTKDKEKGMDKMHERIEEQIQLKKKTQNADIVLLASSILILLIGLIFSMKFRRKKYRY